MNASRGFLKAGIVIGGLLMLAPVVAVLGTVVGMMRAFNTLGGSGISDPRALSRSIAGVLSYMAAGFIAFPVGAVILTVCLVLFFQRRSAGVPPPLPRSGS